MYVYVWKRLASECFGYLSVLYKSAKQLEQGGDMLNVTAAGIQEQRRRSRALSKEAFKYDACKGWVLDSKVRQAGFSSYPIPVCLTELKQKQCVQMMRKDLSKMRTHCHKAYMHSITLYKWQQVKGQTKGPFVEIPPFWSEEFFVFQLFSLLACDIAGKTVYWNV